MGQNNLKNMDPVLKNEISRILSGIYRKPVDIKGKDLPKIFVPDEHYHQTDPHGA